MDIDIDSHSSPRTSGRARCAWNRVLRARYQLGVCFVNWTNLASLMMATNDLLLWLLDDTWGTVDVFHFLRNQIGNRS